eukprot:CAMPEP_0182418296 /NCGR_PEP_ID=MMETSP1167-20130531/2767_1 /TAXON_ID=2988 /ORGANISM="Mallomonas Sp, Strain CCMP3275" /LENGTH=103 /DNA_ID=CAMNT_0024592441 /DNA_START=417 /DNA_END=728 /DNA_ORIENTATION=+
MSQGKLAAQSAHAAIGAVESAKSSNLQSYSFWKQTGEAVICLRVNNDSDLENIMTAAMIQSIPCFAVYDAGRTEVASGTRTCLALGPSNVSSIDIITGNLKLL